MGAESCREAKRCSLFSFFLLLPLPGPPLLGSRLSVKSLSTAKPLGLVPALAPVAILNHGPRSATPLRSGATPDITTTTPAGMETTVLTRVKLRSSNGCRAASHALVLAPVAHPAAVQVSAHVAPVLSLPVAVDRANSMAAVPLVHLVDAVVSVPAEVRVISSVTVDLSAVALLSVRLEAGSSTASTAAVVAARACSGRTSTRL